MQNPKCEQQVKSFSSFNFVLIENLEKLNAIELQEPEISQKSNFFNNAESGT